MTRSLQNWLWIILCFASYSQALSAQVAQNLPISSPCPVLSGGPGTLPEGQPATCVGILTTKPRNGSAGTLAVLQSRTSGVLLIDEHRSLGLGIRKRGDQVEVHGVVKKAGNRWGIALTELKWLASGAELPPLDVLIRELQEGRYAYLLVRVTGELISLADKEVRQLGVQDRSGSLPLRIDSAFVNDPSIVSQLSAGTAVDIVGIVEYHVGKNGRVSPLLRPRNSADLRFLPMPPYKAMRYGVVLFLVGFASLYIVARVRAMHRYASSLETLTETLRQSEAALQLKEQLYRSVTETARDSILTIGREDQILFANRATELLFGWTAQELTDQTLKLLIGENWLSNESGERIEAIGRHKTGDPIAVEVSFSEPSEDHIRTAVIRDVTERKQAENEIRKTNDALRELSGQLLRSQDDERRRIARDLHDGTNQNLAALRINLSILQNTGAFQDEGSRTILVEALALADQSSREIRSLSYLLHPPMLDELGLYSALHSYVEGFRVRSKVDVTLNMSVQVGRLTQECETAIFRIVQEALGNVHRHSGSKRATISLERVANEIVLEISDEGIGMGEAGPSPDQIAMGVGLLGMRERARQLGGAFEILSSPSGTHILVRLPSTQKRNTGVRRSVGEDGAAGGDQDWREHQDDTDETFDTGRITRT